jgi:hypothetical protein
MGYRFSTLAPNYPSLDYRTTITDLSAQHHMPCCPYLCTFLYPWLMPVLLPFMDPTVVKARNHTLAPRQIELGVCQAYAAVLADPSFEWQI